MPDHQFPLTTTTSYRPYESASQSGVGARCSRIPPIPSGLRAAPASVASRRRKIVFLNHSRVGEPSVNIFVDGAKKNRIIAETEKSFIWDLGVLQSNPLPGIADLTSPSHAVRRD